MRACYAEHHFPPRPRKRHRPQRSQRYPGAFFWCAPLPLIILSGLLVNWTFLAQLVFAAPLAPDAKPGHLTFQQYLNEGQHSKAATGPFVRPQEKPKGKPRKQPAALPGAEPATMEPMSQVLTSTWTSASMLQAAGVQPLDFVGSDGRFEVQVAPGTFDLSQAQNSQGQAPSGTLTLQISQVHGHAVGLMNLLGTYQIQILDAQNHPLTYIHLRLPLTVIYHYQLSEMQSLDLNPDHVVLSWPGLLAADTRAKLSTTPDVALFANNASAHTLTAHTSVIDAVASLSVGSEPNNQSVPIPRFASVAGNSGNLSYPYPLQTAPGSAGFAPTMQLVYSSGALNGRHSQVSPGDAAGDGWSVSLGSITETTQVNVTGTGLTTWYFLSGVDKVSDRLLPDPRNAGFFVTEHISHLRIHQVTNSITGQICFHIWDTSGNYYELGCTLDSLQYYTTALGRMNYRWDTNIEKSATQGPNTATNEIVAHYLQDTATVAGLTSVRDAGLQQVQYGMLSGGGTFTASGTVDFLYHAPTASTGHNGLSQLWALSYGTNYNCSTTPPASTTLRCDDPQANGSQAAPATMSTLTLDSIETFVGTDSSLTHLDYAYALAYNQDTPFVACSDPYSGVALYCAGEHTLASITPTAYLAGSGFQQKPTVLTYSAALQNSYDDSLQTNRAGTAPFTGQSSWKYLVAYDDLQTGVGASITYATAWNNSHGNPVDIYDPLFCTFNTTCTGIYANPNDHAWTVQVVTQIQNRGKDSGATSLAVSTTSYYYGLAVTGDGCLGGQTSCVGYEWSPSSDVNWQNYYDAEFRGFSAVYIISPVGDMTVDHYVSTEGFQSSPFDVDNYLTGALLDEEVYSGNLSSGPWLQETDNSYAGQDTSGANSSCDPALITAGEEYPSCETVLLSHAVTRFNGMSPLGPGASEQQTYTYDDYDLTAGLKFGKGAYHNVVEEDINGNQITKLWTYAPNDQDVGSTTYYDVDKVSTSETKDSSGHIWGCTATIYDEGVAAGVPTPAAGWPTKVQTYSNANCSAQTNLREQ